MRWALLTLVLALLLVGPLVAPFDPAAQDRAMLSHAPDVRHWLGTDQYGRDVWSRFLAGGSWSLLTGLGATSLILVLSLAIGGFAGWRGGWVDRLLMYTGDLFLSLPWLYVLIGLRAVMPLDMAPRKAEALMLLAIAMVSWARPARLVRGVVAAEISRGYVIAARGFGRPAWRIFTDHVLGALWNTLLAQGLTLLPRFVLAEVTLAFLGLGASGAEASWGELILPLQDPYLLTSQWWRILPLLLMMPLFACCAVVARAAMRGTRTAR